MFSTRIDSAALDGRLDPGHFRPEFQVVADRVHAVPGVKAETIDAFVQWIGQPSDLRDYSEDGVPILNAGDIRPLWVESSNLKRIDFARALTKDRQRLRGDETLVVRTGANCGDCASSGSSGRGLLVNSHIIPIRPKPDSVNPDYLAVFLATPQGQLLLDREMTGTAQRQISVQSLLDTLVLVPRLAAQGYIGSKVRQAEVLREWAGRQLNAVKAVLDGALPGLPGRPSPWNRVAVVDLQERLDPRPYRSHRLQLRSALVAGSSTRVGDIATLMGGNPVSSDDFVEAGVPLIKNGDIRADGFKEPTTNSVSRDFHDANRQYWAREGMVVVSLDGDIRAQSFVLEDLPAHVNQRVAMLTVHGMPSALLAAWINHPVVQEQMHSWSVQTTVEHISNAIVAKALVPRFAPSEEARLGRSALSARRARHYARKLITAARLLVEALIERKVTEAELIEAGKNADADRALLARLAEDGLDGAGAPLFADLDGLAELISGATRAGDGS